MANSAWSVLVGVELDSSASKIKQQLDKQAKGITVKVGAEGTSEATRGLKSVASAADDVTLSYQAANKIFQESIDIISSMVDQVFNLQNAMLEFQKVSSLSGEALDDYVAKLADMGGQVARTGKPWCLSRNVQMVNVH